MRIGARLCQFKLLFAYTSTQLIVEQVVGGGLISWLIGWIEESVRVRWAQHVKVTLVVKQTFGQRIRHLSEPAYVSVCVCVCVRDFESTFEQSSEKKEQRQQKNKREQLNSECNRVLLEWWVTRRQIGSGNGLSLFSSFSLRTLQVGAKTVQ